MRIDASRPESGSSPPPKKIRSNRIIAELAAQMGVVCKPNEILTEEAGDEIAVSFHCSLDPATPLAAAHRFSERFELALKNGVPRVGRVTIHIEPPEPTGPS